MKKRQGMFFGFAVLLIAALFTVAGCGDSGGGPTGGTPQTATYSGAADGQTYKLTVTEDTSRAVYTPQAGDSYVLTAGGKTSGGAVNSFTGGVLTLKPSNSTTTFTASVSGNSLEGFSGSVTWNGQSTPESLPGTLTPTGGNNGGGSGNLVNAEGEAWVFMNTYDWGEAYIFYSDNSFESYIYSESTYGGWSQAPGIPRDVGTYETSGNTLRFFGEEQLLWTRTYSVSGRTLTLTDDTGSTEYTAQAFDGSNNGGGNNGGDDGFTAAWPSASVLAQFDLAGLTQPSTGTGFEYRVDSAANGSALGIVFTGGVPANDAAIKQCISSNGWVLDEGSSWEDETGCWYVYGEYAVNHAMYSRTMPSGNSTIQVYRE